tara:strand:+ start:366 stop:1247 length:882 start_codon:yes stop_codon:yes gene_type:complete
MPYIGNTSANRFVASKSASVFSGDGSTTAFTLDHGVGSDEDILVSVDGVIQEPSVGYSVSGTTLTFTSAPSSNSGNNIFVYYLFRTVGTVSHPSSNALEATSGTFTGNIVIPNDGNIGSASDTDAIAINSSGVVTQSAKPRFHARRTGSAQSESDSSNADAIFNTKDFDIQMSYNTSNGQCTITHTGLYLFYTNITITRDDSDLRDAGIGILVNGSAKANTLERYATNDVGQTQLALSALLSLSATDVVKVRVFANSVSGNNVNYVSHNMGGLNANADFDTTGFCSFFGGYMI